MIPFGRQRADTRNSQDGHLNPALAPEHQALELRVNDKGLVKVVAVMPEAVQAQSRSQPYRLTLNSDGQAHPVLNVLALFTLVVGIAAFALGLVVQTHLAATILGMIGFGVGLAAQLNSATREERIVLVTGIIAAFVGMALGIGHGGFA
jgi:hypothetical protein